MTICHHFPNINSGMRLSHLLAKEGMCGSVCVCVTHLLQPGLCMFLAHIICVPSALLMSTFFSILNPGGKPPIFCFGF